MGKFPHTDYFMMTEGILNSAKKWENVMSGVCELKIVHQKLFSCEPTNSLNFVFLYMLYKQEELTCFGKKITKLILPLKIFKIVFLTISLRHNMNVLYKILSQRHVTNI